MVWLKISWISDQPGFYTPYLPKRGPMRESPNMIVRAAVAIETLERWAKEYEEKYSYKTQGALVTPKAQIGAIRAGNPNSVSGTSLDVFGTSSIAANFLGSLL